MMKYIRIFAFSLFFLPVCAFAATNEFMVAAQLLAAARNADIQQVQSLVNNGADVNFTDSTGLRMNYYYQNQKHRSAATIPQRQRRHPPPPMSDYGRTTAR